MAQGKKFTPEQKETIINSLQPNLELGFSRNKACELIGLNPMTLSSWLSDDESLLMKIQGWENAMNTLVMRNLKEAIILESTLEEDNRKETTRWWAERKMKHEGFSQKIEQELSNPDGNLKTIVINKNGSTNQSTS